MKRRKNNKYSKEQFENLLNALHETELSFSGIQENSNEKNITEDELSEKISNSSVGAKGTLFDAKCAQHLFYHFVNAVNFNSKSSYNVICKYVRQKRKLFLRTYFPSAISFEKKNIDEDDLNDLLSDIDNFISGATGASDVYSSDLSLRLINPSLLHVVETACQKFDPNFRYIFLQLLSAPLESFTDKHLSVGNGYDLNTFFELTVFYLRVFCIIDKNESMDSALLKECLPPQLAFLIGRAYLNGEYLPLDKELAFRWFAYGALLGDSKCLMAFLLHFSNLDCSDEQKLSKCALKIRFTLFYAYLNTSYSTKHPELYEYPCYYEQEGFSSYEMYCLARYLKYTASSSLFLKKTSRDDLYELDLFARFDSHICYLANVNKKDINLLSAIMLFCYTFYDESVFEGFYKELYHLSRPRAKTPDEPLKFFSDIFVSNAKKGGLFALECLNIFSLFSEFDLETEDELLKRMSDAGMTEASFILATKQKRMSKDTSGTEFWKKPAKDGCGFGYLNLAVDYYLEKDYEQCIVNAKIAISYGVVAGFMLLYSAYKESNPPLAYTYLRIASEYVIPDAYRELASEREEDKYNPLPYMKIVEKIESLSAVSSTACVLMIEFYKNSTLLPENHIKIAEYIQRSLKLGVGSSVDEYMDFYSRSFKSDWLYPPSIPTNLNSFGSLRKIYSVDSKVTDSQDPHYEEVKKLSEALMFSLRHGTTELEQICLYNIVSSQIMDVIGVKSAKGLNAIKSSSESVLNSYSLLLSLGATKSLKNGDKNVITYYTNTTHALSDALFQMDERTLHFIKAKALHCIRAYTLECDYENYLNEINKAANAEDPLSYLLKQTDFSDIIKQRNTSVKSKEADDQNTKEDVVILNVTQ